MNNLLRMKVKALYCILSKPHHFAIVARLFLFISKQLPQYFVYKSLSLLPFKCIFCLDCKFFSLSPIVSL